MTSIILAEKQSDILLISKLAYRIWNEHYPKIIGQEQVTYMVDKFQSQNTINQQIKEGYVYYLINHNNTSVGYICIIKKDDSLFLSKIYIDKEYRGQKIGKTAMAFIEQQAKELGCTNISLTVNKNNTNSINTYKKIGFKTEGPIVIDIGNGFIMDDYKMIKELQ